MPLHKYKIDYFTRKHISPDNMKLLLSKENMEIIDNITSKVSCQNYNKTPMFKKKDTRRFLERNIHKQFKPTVFFNNYTSFDNFINEFRTILNKITINNYNEKKNALDLLLLNSIEEDIFENDDNIKILQKVFFDILFVSKLSKLFVDLSLYFYDKFNIFKFIFNKQYDEYKYLIKTIKYIDPDTNYEIFCMNNSKNDRIVILTKFYLVLINNEKYNIDCFDEISNLILEEFKSKWDDADEKNCTDELYKHINILVDYEIENKNSDTTISFIKYIYSNYRKHNGISKKMIFKVMDLIEKYNIV